MISSLPTSMSKLNTILKGREHMEVLHRAYFRDTRPTLLIVVRTPLNDVAKSKLSMDTISTDATRINTYAAKYTLMPRSVSCPTLCRLT